MKRLYICSYKDAGWISGIVAESRKQAKQLFYKIWKGVTDDVWDEWIRIRVHLFKLKLDVSNLPLGEIDDDWGYALNVYTEK